MAGSKAANKGRQAKAKGNRSRLYIVGGIAALLAISLIVFIATSGSGKVSSADQPIEGVKTFTELTPQHVNGPVSYPQTPPAGGDHAQAWLNCAIYAEPVPNENAVHSLEHGAVWITYDPALITGEQLNTLREAIPNTFVILSPYLGLPAAIVASAWGVQLQVNQANDPRIAAFIEKYRESKLAPEPGAPCSGGVDGPGKVS